MKKLRHLNAKLPSRGRVPNIEREKEKIKKAAPRLAAAAECHQHMILKHWKKGERIFSLLAAPFQSLSRPPISLSRVSPFVLSY